MVEIAANNGEAVSNELIRGEIRGLKTDENGTGLSRAVIGLFQSDETEFTAENALATATSAEDGSFSFADVPFGDWVLKELESPAGFILSDEVIPVTVLCVQNKVLADRNKIRSGRLVEELLKEAGGMEVRP